MKIGTLPQNKPINPDRLHEEMKAALGDKYVSMDTGVRDRLEDTNNMRIVVRLTDEATDDDKQKVDTVFAAHDPAALSTAQQKQKDRADAFTRMVERDFKAVRQSTGKAQIDALIDALEDVQRLLQGAGL